MMTDVSGPGLSNDASEPEGCPQDDKHIVKWMEAQPIGQARLARERINEFLQSAQSRHASGNACIKLCYFLEQCRASNSPEIRNVACSKKTCLDLFTFYIEWNEKNQHRSMRQVLELVATVISTHPDDSIAAAVKSSILQKLVSVIMHRASQPLVKPAFKALECFLSKGTLSTAELESVYQEQLKMSEHVDNAAKDTVLVPSWDFFVAEVFDWMGLPDIAPAAGKFLVTLFRELRRSQNTTGVADQTYLWQQWIRNSLSKDSDALENIKYYLFPPLFKLDRAGSLVFLEDLNRQKPMSDLKNQDLNAYSFLQLAALEAGKKAGLVEEPDTVQFQKTTKKAGKYVILQEDAIGAVMSHTSNTVRSLAFSVLVSSSSSIRPFSSTTLDILQQNLGSLYADTDAKFRNEVLSKTKHMIERLRGATASLVREIDNLSFTPFQDEKHQEKPVFAPETHKTDSSLFHQANQKLLEQASLVLQRHESFIEWYLELLMGELIPTCSYQRHITALRAINLLLRSGILDSTSGIPATKDLDNSTVWPYTIKFFTSQTMRLLLDLVMDPFEDVRSSTISILKLASSDSFTLTPLSRRLSRPNSTSRPSSSRGPDKQIRRRTSQADVLEAFTKETTELWSARPLGLLMDFVARAEGLSKRTGRADYADGVARAYELLYGLLDTSDSRIGLVEDLVHQLERKVSIAEGDLARAVLIAPIHGNFAALSFVWEIIDHSNHMRRFSMDLAAIEESCTTWDNLQWRILSACARIWEAVKDVLCNDSPEGHLPQDLDDVDDIDTKDVLSYSFRATHESSNLMRAMVSKIKSKWQNGRPILPSGLFADIGNLTFNQLASLRHRGAFSTVSLTFARCCQLVQLQSPEEKQAIDLLEEWYQAALGCIFEQASTTRRSAGIPALLTGILSANAQVPAFQEVMNELKDLARQPVRLSETDETKLPQVHAMNCIKEIFKSSTLGKRSEGHIADCLQLAADSLNSEIWAIRNCGLILLRSLIDCLFGTSESKLVTEAGWDGRSIRISYDKYPALPELLLKLLDAEISGTESLNGPAIGAVESVFPALDILRRAGPPDAHREQIRRSVSLHLGSKVWHIREIAARTMCTLLLHENWFTEMTELFESCHSSTNRLHGVLLAFKFVLERRRALGFRPTTRIFEGIKSLLELIPGRFPSLRGCPDVLAAFFEVNAEILKTVLSIRNAGIDPVILQNITDKIGLSESYENNESYMTVVVKGSEKSRSSALLRNAIARRAIYAAVSNGQTRILGMIVNVAKTDTDTLLAALGCMLHASKLTCAADELKELSEVYLAAATLSESADTRSLALTNLAEILDRLTYEQPHFWFTENLSGLGNLLESGGGSPQLSNAEIRISGSILLREYLKDEQGQSEVLQKRLEAWGEMIGMAGDPNNDFDTRCAAAAALNSFYNNRQAWRVSPCLLPSLLALYDTLSDDDDEIRDQGAATVSSLLEKSLIPLAAAEQFLQYVWEHFRSSKGLAWNAVCRITGNQHQSLASPYLPLRPAEIQFSQAMADDDSLFVEEEQNLFFDEVRDAKIWAALFEKRMDSSWAESTASLAAWVLDGLHTMKMLISKSDGPLGWTSKPSVFAECMRVIISANALLRSSLVNLSSSVPDEDASGTSKVDVGLRIQTQITDRIANDLESLILLSAEKQFHESLICEIQGSPPLILTCSRKETLRLASVSCKKQTALVKYRERQQTHQQYRERQANQAKSIPFDRRLSDDSSPTQRRSLDPHK